MKNNQNPTETIYDCLNSDFWTKRQCSHCQYFFSSDDYQKQNYQLYFEEVNEVIKVSKQGKIILNYAFLEGVLVKLFHKSCQKVKYSPQDCRVEIMKDITCL